MVVWRRHPPCSPGWLCSHHWGPGSRWALATSRTKKDLKAHSHEPEGAYTPEKHLLARHPHLDRG